MKNKLVMVGAIFACLVLLVGCANESWKSLDIEIVDHEKRCLASEKESIAKQREGEDIIVTTVFSTPVPCYQIKSISARQKENKIEVKIKVEREEVVCTECVGFQKITFRIKAPRLYPKIDLESQVEIDGQIKMQNIKITEGEKHRLMPTT